MVLYRKNFYQEYTEQPHKVLTLILMHFPNKNVFSIEKVIRLTSFSQLILIDQIEIENLINQNNFVFFS